MRRLPVLAALLLALPCHAASWSDQVVLMSPDSAHCSFWQLFPAGDFSRSSVTLDWDIVDQLRLEIAGKPDLSIAVALDQWDAKKGAPRGDLQRFDTAAYCTVSTQAPAAKKPESSGSSKGGKGKDKKKSKSRAKPAEAALVGTNISEIACYRRDGAGRTRSVFARRTQQARRDGMVRYSHACTEGCEQAPFQQLHELSMDDGPGNPAHEKDLEALYKACVRR